MCECAGTPCANALMCPGTSLNSVLVLCLPVSKSMNEQDLDHRQGRGPVQLLWDMCGTKEAQQAPVSVKHLPCCLRFSAGADQHWPIQDSLVHLMQVVCGLSFEPSSIPLLLSSAACVTIVMLVYLYVDLFCIMYANCDTSIQHTLRLHRTQSS